MSARDTHDTTPDAGAVPAQGADTDTSVPSSESGELGTGSDEEFLRAAVAVPKLVPPSEEPDRIGTALGHYEIREVLGRGGMGIVYGADDDKLGRRVALKVLPSSLATDTKRRSRLLREARAASAITHPNIATVYEVGEADGLVYIAMECVEGETLRKRLEHGPLAPEEATRIVREIARALAKAHRAGIVHRDLKPDNVMVGADGLVKILDFGLAKPTGSRGTKIDSVTVLSTVEGRVLGTPSYMSPEQAKGKQVDARSDLFSLGVVLYELLSGRRPFTGDGTMEILIAIDRDTPRPLRDVPQSLQRVVSRCLAKDPAERFATAEDLIAALDTKPPRRERPWIPLALVFGIACAAVIAWQQLHARASAGASVPPVTEATSHVSATPEPPPAPSTAAAPVASAAPHFSEPLAKPVSSRRPAGPLRPPPSASAGPGGKRDPLAEQK